MMQTQTTINTQFVTKEKLNVRKLNVQLLLYVHSQKLMLYPKDLVVNDSISGMVNST